MPSKPNLQACWNTVGPSPSVCSLNTMPAAEPASNRASFALRSPSGSGRSRAMADVPSSRPGYDPWQVRPPITVAVQFGTSLPA
jgi:hypothetical protein